MVHLLHRLYAVDAPAYRRARRHATVQQSIPSNPDGGISTATETYLPCRTEEKTNSPKILKVREEKIAKSGNCRLYPHHLLKQKQNTNSANIVHALSTVSF